MKLLLVGLLSVPFPLLGAQAPDASARPRTSAHTGAVAEFLRAQRERYGFAGVSVAWVGGGGRAGAVAVGLADVEAGRKLEPGDRLLSGSVGKTYVAALALLMVDAKELTLDDRAAATLSKRPWFAALPNASTLTLRALLRHRSGIPEYVYNPEFLRSMKADPDKVWNRGEQLALVAGAKPLFAVERGWSYADTNYLLIGEWLAARRGQDVEKLLRKEILDRFELESTVFSNRRAVPGLVPGYTQLGRMFGTPVKTVSKGRYAINPQFEGCGGGFASTAADLARWGRIFVRGRFLSPALRKARAATVPAKGLGEDAGYGLGLIRRSSTLGPALGHSGFMPGFRAEMFYFPTHDLSVALMFNTDQRAKLGKAPLWYLDQVAGLLTGARKPPQKSRSGR